MDQKLLNLVTENDLKLECRALYIDGIGALDQYGSYVETFWEKGVCYFLRDYYLSRLPHDPTLKPKLDALNSEISVRCNHPAARVNSR